MNMERLLDIENAAASMMTEMPESRHEYKPDGLPFEGLDPAFCVPVDFDQIVGILWEDLKTLEGHAIAANRYSENYLSCSRELETMMRKLGSLLVSQAVLERQGHVVSCPKGLTVGELKWTAGYHFNKTHSAVKGTQNANIRFYLAMLQQETRWAGLIGRLNATEEKIRLIREGKLEVRLVPEQAEENKSKRASRCESNHEEIKTVKAALPAALPMDKDVLRAAAGSDVRVVKSGTESPDSGVPAEGHPGSGGSCPAASGTGIEENARPEKTVPAESGTGFEEKTRPETKPAETEIKETIPVPAETEGNTPAAAKPAETYPEPDAGAAEVKAETGIMIPRPLSREEENLRGLLLDAAVRTVDRALWETAAEASGPELLRLWERFLKEDEKKGYPYLRELEKRAEKNRPPDADDWDGDEWAEDYAYDLIEDTA